MGLQRVRTFCLADAHIVCATEEQAVEEAGKALDLIEYVAGVFGLKLGEHYRFRLSLGDRSNTEKYYKNDEAWEKSEDLLRKHLQSRGSDFEEAKDEAAFYGPKIDVQMKNVNGKEDTAFTVQYDFCMPDRFDLEYTASDGTKKRAFVIHRSSIGAIERVMAFLIEHYAGAFPLWLAPVQARVITVGDEQKEYAEKIVEALKDANIRAELDPSNESLGKKIRAAKQEKLPYFIVIGGKEVESNTVTLEARAGGSESITLEAATSRLTDEIKTKKI
jgi:threonyl-tRNA synthetase